MGSLDSRINTLQPVWAAGLPALRQQGLQLIVHPPKGYGSLQCHVLAQEDIVSPNPTPPHILVEFPYHPLSPTVRVRTAHLHKAIPSALLWTVPAWATRLLNECMHDCTLSIAWWMLRAIANEEDPMGKAGAIASAVALGASLKEACQALGIQGIYDSWNYGGVVYPWPATLKFQVMNNWYTQCMRKPSIAHKLPVP